MLLRTNCLFSRTTSRAISWSTATIWLRWRSSASWTLVAIATPRRSMSSRPRNKKSAKISRMKFQNSQTNAAKMSKNVFHQYSPSCVSESFLRLPLTRNARRTTRFNHPTPSRWSAKLPATFSRSSASLKVWLMDIDHHSEKNVLGSYIMLTWSTSWVLRLLQTYT